MIDCDCCGEENLSSYPSIDKGTTQSYEWVEEDRVDMKLGDTLYDSFILCRECDKLLRDKNWQELAKRNLLTLMGK